MKGKACCPAPRWTLRSAFFNVPMWLAVLSSCEGVVGYGVSGAFSLKGRHWARVSVVGFSVGSFLLTLALSRALMLIPGSLVWLSLLATLFFGKPQRYFARSQT